MRSGIEKDQNKPECHEQSRSEDRAILERDREKFGEIKTAEMPQRIGKHSMITQKTVHNNKMLLGITFVVIGEYLHVNQKEDREKNK